MGRYAEKRWHNQFGAEVDVTHWAEILVVIEP